MVKSDKTRPVSFKVITDIKFQLLFFPPPKTLVFSNHLSCVGADCVITLLQPSLLRRLMDT